MHIPMSEEQLRELNRQHEKWLYGEVTGPEEPVKIIKRSFHDMDLTGSVWRHAIFYSCKFTECFFKEADLRWASFEGSEFVNCSLSWSNLSDASMNAASFINTNLRHSNMTRTNFHGVRTILRACVDPRGYEIKMWKEPDGSIWVSSGCRSFVLGDALAHWGYKYMPTERGKAYRHTIKMLKQVMDIRDEIL